MKTIPILLGLLSSLSFAGSFPGAVGSASTDAIYKDSAAFVAWANGNLSPEYGTGVDSAWKTPRLAHGPATTDGFDIVCLGNGGKITLYFPRPIRDEAGPDFAIFENTFSPGFLELAFVEVSSDGSNFYRFPNRSEGTSLVGAFAYSMDPTDLNGLAGKYVKGYGTPFDIGMLSTSPLLDRKNIRFVRLIDIVGDGSVLDTSGQPIYDPTPTTGSGGFDLDAIGVIHQSFDPIKILRSEMVGASYRLGWESNPGTSYRIETSTTLDVWATVQTLNGNQVSNYTEVMLTTNGSNNQFWRIISDGPSAFVSNDKSGPKLSVISKTSKFTARKFITLKGTAKDPNGVAIVQFKVGKGPLRNAKGTTAWKVQTQLKKGQNKITILTSDRLGNLTRKSVKVERT